MGTPASPTDIKKNDVDSPLLPLLILTVITGLVDAVSYLQLGRVFVANMTGNVVFLGFAVAGAQDFSIPASLTAVAAFLLGAAAGGRLGSSMAQHRNRFLGTVMVIKLVLIGAAFVLAIAMKQDNVVRYGLIVLLGASMGLQNAAARLLAVPDLTTTVLTLTLTGLAADSTFAGGTNPRIGRRLVATVAMFVGAAVGAFIVLNIGFAATLALTLILLVFNAVAAYRMELRSAA